MCGQQLIRAEARDELREHLAEREIGSGLDSPGPLYLQECFSKLGYRKGDLPVSEQLCHEALSLPVYPELDQSASADVAGAIREFYGG